VVVDPEGHLFFSTGADGMGPWMARAPTGATEYSPPFRRRICARLLFAPIRRPWFLPHLEPATAFRRQLAGAVGGPDVAPHGRLGPEHHRQLSDPRLAAAKREPYIATLRGWGVETGFLGLPDVFAEDLRKRWTPPPRSNAPAQDDPWLIGYFIANEPPWPGRETEIVSAILQAPASPIQSEAKKFLAGGDTPERRREFVNHAIEKFLDTVNAAIHRHDPNHLNLGIRFGSRPSEAMLRASRGFDVFSMNSYGYEVNRQNVEAAYRVTQKPVLIGEFHFGTPGRGLAAGLLQTKNQEERGVAYRYYVENAAANPPSSASIGSSGRRAEHRPDGRGELQHRPGRCHRPALRGLIEAMKATHKRLLEVHFRQGAAGPPPGPREMKTGSSAMKRQPARDFLARRVVTALLCAMPFLAAAGASSVKVTEEDIVIPLILAGDPEPNPMFYFGRNSQGAAGRVYPYPLYDSLTHVKTNKTYRIVWLENEYLRIGILPDIGGRLFEAVDKSNGYNFIYRQHVIKPALIGLIGAWISGGIEWNIPHHHRASTFLPAQYRVETKRRRRGTVWVGELELRQRMRWAVGYTLHPGKSYLECSVRVLNRTPFPNTMLCFANVAVSVNSNYQVIYPPGTQYVTYHGKREFASWPVATGRYSGADFGAGTDVSWYSNHFPPTPCSPGITRTTFSPATTTANRPAS